MRQRLCVLSFLILVTACEVATPVATPIPPIATTPTQAAYPIATPIQRTPAVRLTAPAPTPTATATRPPPPTSAAASAGTLPPPPSKLSDLPQAILAYLNADPQNFSNLRPLLNAWGVNSAGSPLDSVGDIMMNADMDGDGQQDLILALAQSEPNTCDNGALVLYLRQGNGYRLAQQVGLLDIAPIDPSISHIPCPKIFAARDLLKDGRLAIIISSTTCGAHTCVVKLNSLRWDGKDLRSLMAQPLPSMASPEISFQESGRGTTDLVLHGGIIGSVGAGPQRARTEVYRWNGSQFALTEAKFDMSNYLYFTVIDANTLLQEQKHKEAIALYQEAISNLRLAVWHDENERTDLQAFARFRSMVAYALLGDFASAQSAKDDLLAKQPRHPYARVAQAFWETYAPQQNVALGCISVTAIAQADPAIPAVLSDFGYANPDFKAEDVCPFKR